MTDFRENYNKSRNATNDCLYGQKSREDLYKAILAENMASREYVRELEAEAIRQARRLLEPLSRKGLSVELRQRCAEARGACNNASARLAELRRLIAIVGDAAEYRKAEIKRLTDENVALRLALSEQKGVTP
jgi:hypothetical protein